MKRILLVSASNVFLKRNRKLLMARGIDILTASCGEEALQLNEEHLFDIIISELELEGMDGSKLCSQIHMSKSTRFVPVILICYDMFNSIQRVEQSGANAMILKPIDPIQLLETIGSFLDMQIGRSKRVVINVRVLSKKLDLEFLCLSHDISNTGLLLETEHQVSLGERIICQFTIGDSFHIEAEGEVIRCMSVKDCKNLFGVKFTAIPLSSRKAIDSYIESMHLPAGSTRNFTAD